MKTFRLLPKKWHGYVSLAMLMLAVSCSKQENLPVKKTDSSEKAIAQVMAVTNFSSDGAWCWFSDPRAVHYEGYFDRTYIGAITRDGSIKIMQYDHVTRAATSTLLHAVFSKDDHNNPSVLVRADGRLIVFYSKHSLEPSMYYKISTNREDISSWGAERVINTINDVTYANPVMLSAENNRIYLFSRSIGFKPSVTWSDDQGLTWSTNKMLLNSTAARPYVKVETNGINEIHFAFTDGHPRNVPTNSIYYMKYESGAGGAAGSFYKANGTLIKSFADAMVTPISVQTQTEKLYDGGSGGGKSWVWDIALDRAGNPKITYVKFPSDRDHRYWYLNYNGTSWTDRFIATGGGWFQDTPAGTVESEPNYSGGVVLDHEDPSVVYLSRPGVTGNFEIQKYSTSDGGASWNATSVTTASTDKNIRPIVPRHHKPGELDVLWMYGSYISFTNYATSIKTNFNFTAPPTGVKLFDFGSATSPLAMGYTQVTEARQYTTGGYGWVVPAGNLSRDRGDTSDELKRDLVYNSVTKSFTTAIANGTYTVKVVMGDATFSHDYMSITANGTLVASNINTAIGEWKTISFPVTISNGTLTLDFADNGGASLNWVVNSIRIN